jgi:hypothetical protein
VRYPVLCYSNAKKKKYFSFIFLFAKLTLSVNYLKGQFLYCHLEIGERKKEEKTFYRESSNRTVFGTKEKPSS